MDSKAFLEMSAQMSGYIASYLDTIRERRVLPDVQPGYLRPMLPEAAPEDPDTWDDVMADVEKVLMPGVTHWQSPRFHAYYPSASSYPSVLADMLSSAIGCIGITWIAGPACTELETIMMDWLAKMLALPEVFLSTSQGKGGGIIQGSASEATLVALLGAKKRAIRKAKVDFPDLEESDVVSKLVAYASNQSHSSVEKAGLLGGVTMTLLPTDDDNVLRGDTLAKAIAEDRDKGLIPFYAVATLGTTTSCAFDALAEIGAVCNAQHVWLHVDAAYAGAAFVCPELRHLCAGVERADSFNFNPHKWLLVNFDCAAMWYKDPTDVVDAVKVDPLYLRQQHQETPDYRHWQIPLGRRFRSLKLWFTLRLYGARNIRSFIRKQIALAHQFERLAVEDGRFEIYNEVVMGLVCFRLKGDNQLTETLLKKINGRGVIFLVPSKIREVFFLRLAVCSRFTEPEDIDLSWAEIRTNADAVLPGK